jgi:hypothetical protein
MAILNYDGTTLGALANSGFFRRFFSEFMDDAGQVWRVEVLDSVTTSDGFSFADDAPQGFRLGPDGATLSYKGKGESLHSPFVNSELTFDFLLEGTYRIQLATELAKCKDERFAVGLFKHKPHPASSSTSTTTQDPSPTGYWVPEWFGIIKPEGVERLTNEPNSFLRITATDGLEILNQVDYKKPDGTFYDDAPRLIQVIGRCLQYLPTAKLWGFNGYGDATDSSDSVVWGSPSFFREYIYQYAEDEHLLDTGPQIVMSVLHNTAVNSPTFYNIKTVTDPLGGDFIEKDSASCAKVLESILEVFMARLFLSGGSWCFMNPGAIDADETPNVHEWATLDSLDVSDSTTGTISSVVVDLDAEKIEPLSGLVDRSLFPIKRAVSLHKGGGSMEVLVAPPTAILNPSGTHGGPRPTWQNDYGYIEFYPYYIRAHDSSEITTIQNTAAHIPNGTELTIKTDFGLSETGRHDGSITEPDGVGLKAVVEIIIKVGAYYLKRDLVHSGGSDTIVIQRNGQSNLDYQPLEQSGAIEWTTVSSSYSMVVPFIGCDPEAPVVTQGYGDDAVDRVGGLHTAGRESPNDDHYMHRSGLFGNGTEHDGIMASFNWTLPALPDVAAGFDGMSFSAYVDYYKYDGTQLDYSETSFLQYEIPGVFANFRIVTGDGGNGNTDAFFSSTVGENRAEIYASRSILGDSISGQMNGVLLVEDVNTAGTDYTTGGERWVNLAGPSDSEKYIHQLNANDLTEERARSLLIRQGSFLFDPAHHLPGWNNITYKALPRFRDLWGVTIAGTMAKLLPLNLSWTIKSRLFDFEGVAIDFDRTIPITSDDNTDAIKGEAGSGGITGVPGTKSTQALILNSSDSEIPSDFNFTKFNFDALGLTTLIASDLGSGNKTITLAGDSSVNIQTLHDSVKRLLEDYEDYDGHLKIHAPIGKVATPTLYIYKINPDASTESTEKVSIQAPSDLASDYTLILPKAHPTQATAVMTYNNTGRLAGLADGAAGEFLSTNGGGVLSWAAAGGSDGWHGATTLVKVLPSEFIMNDDYTRAPIAIEDDTTDVLGVRLPASSAEMYAFKAIPTGYKATHVKVYASASTSSAVDVLSFNQTTGATASKGSGDLGALIDITDVTSSATSNLVIKVSPASVTTVIYGADITIATV